MWAVLIISLTGYKSSATLVMKQNSFFSSDLKVVLLVAVTTSLERFTFFLVGLSDLDDSAIFIFWVFFKRFVNV